jgi:hypothetical protein
MLPRVQEWFNTSAFEPNAIGTFGDTSKNILRGPRYFEADLAAIKNAKITDRLSILNSEQSSSMHSTMSISADRTVFLPMPVLDRLLVWRERHPPIPTERRSPESFNLD